MIIRPIAHFSQRPINTKIDTVIIHSMTAGDSCSAELCCKLLEDHEVSTHYLITNDGKIWQCVSEDQRAWHAGVSKMPFDEYQRESVNDFSIGIELITPTDNSFTADQYAVLAVLVKELATRHPIKYILGHDQIAVGRKTDPGEKFLWEKLKGLLGDSRFVFWGMIE